MTNFRDGNLDVGQAFPALTKTVLLTADNQAIDPDSMKMILVGSNNTTATNRTFTINPSTIGVGHELTLYFNTGSSTTAELADSGTMKLITTWTPVQYDTLSLIWDGTNWNEVSRGTSTGQTALTLASAHLFVGNGSNVATDVAVTGDVSIDNTGLTAIASGVIVNADVNASAAIAFSKLAAMTSASILLGAGTTVPTVTAVTGDVTIDNTGVTAIGAAKVTVAMQGTAVMIEATGTLSQANIQGMNASPVSLISAPGAGKLNIVDEIELFHDFATAAYTNGGDVTIQYNTSAKPIQVLDVAWVTGGSDTNLLVKPSASYTSSASTSSETDLSGSINKAIEITNATAAFATGNASNIIKYRLRYHTVTVLT